MATKVKGIKVGVNIMQKAVTFVANSVINEQLRIAHGRGLDPSYLQSNLEIIENGLRTWLSEQKIHALLLQVFLPDREDALENWETIFIYYADPIEEVRQLPIKDIEKACTSLAKLPPGATYRIFASVDPDASEVAGWVSGVPKPIISMTEKVFKSWGFHDIGVEIRYQGGEFGA